MSRRSLTARTRPLLWLLLIAVAAPVAHAQTRPTRSRDGSWRRLLTGSVSQVVTAPNGTILVGSNSRLGVLRSTNGGTAWTEVPFYPGQATASVVSALAVDKKGVFYAGVTATGLSVPPPPNVITEESEAAPAVQKDLPEVANHGVFRSVDDGKSWAPVPPQSILRNIAWIGISSFDGTVYAGTVNPKAITSAIKLAPKGDQWIDLGEIEGQTTRSLFWASGWVCATTNSGFYCRGSKGWVQRRDEETWSAYRDDTGTIYLGTANSKVLKSTNIGTSWLPAGRGLPRNYVQSLIMDSRGTLFAAIKNAGVYYTTNGGRTWRPLPRTGLAGTLFPSMTVTKSGSLIVSTDVGLFRFPLAKLYGSTQTGTGGEQTTTRTRTPSR